MPNIEEIGPKTLKRLKAIKDETAGKVEELGRLLGIPEDKDLLYEILMIDEIREMRAHNDRLHAAREDKDGHKFDPLRFGVSLFNQIAGLCANVAKELGKFIQDK
jgi:hypothetical protein